MTNIDKTEYATTYDLVKGTLDHCQYAYDPELVGIIAGAYRPRNLM